MTIHVPGLLLWLRDGSLVFVEAERLEKLMLPEEYQPGGEYHGEVLDVLERARGRVTGLRGAYLVDKSISHEDWAGSGDLDVDPDVLHEEIVGAEAAAPSGGKQRFAEGPGSPTGGKQRAAFEPEE